MLSYVVTRPLRRVFSASAFCSFSVAARDSIAFNSSTLDSMRFSAAFSRFSRMSISRARVSSSCLRDCSRSRIARSDGETVFALSSGCITTPSGLVSGTAGFGASSFGAPCTEPVTSFG